jgi:hypothetical protein
MQYLPGYDSYEPLIKYPETMDSTEFCFSVICSYPPEKIYEFKKFILFQYLWRKNEGTLTRQ